MIDLNTAFEDEIYAQYLLDPLSVSPAWRDYFAKSKEKITSQAILESKETKLEKVVPKTQDVYVDKNAEVVKMSSIQSKISDNMEISLEIPTATSVRAIPVKVLDENRRIVNKYLQKQKNREYLLLIFSHGR
ncbi:MAG: hypothetical protein WCT77_07100 [Bacteroidota bacterium]